MGVSFFKYIIDLRGGSLIKREKRRAPRYPVGEIFPVKGVVAFCTNLDRKGQPPPSGTEHWQNWSGRLLNLSDGGASIQLAASAIGARGHICKFKLQLEGRQLEMPGTIAYFRSFTQYSLCGLSFSYPEETTRQGYLQLLEMVVLGSSLKAAGKAKAPNGLTRETYKGAKDTRLNVWRNTASETISHFEFRIADCYIRGNAQNFKLEVDATEGEHGLSASAGRPAPFPPAKLAEAKQLFRWVVTNLPKEVPSNIKKFLEMFIK